MLYRFLRRRCFVLSGSSIAFVFLLCILLRKQGRQPIKVTFDDDDNDVKILIRNDRKQKEYIDKKGMHVVVGRYTGDSVDTPTFTAQELNSNHYRGIEGVGYLGRPVLLKQHEQRGADRLWHINKFNIVASDKIFLNRTLPDVRQEACAGLNYDVDKLPETSVVIVFHNEAWSTLLRTVHSVINTCPRKLLKEIILVDDASNRTFLKSGLDNYMASLDVPTKVVRSKSRVGLIKARLLGSREAIGDVLTFLDAHCECTTGWIEPLLERIRISSQSVVCPVIDIINDDTFAYVKSFSLHWGAFNWELHFRWYTMGYNQIAKFRNDSTAPYRTPVMAGGLFSVDRSYFWDVGGYDEKMEIWGGENLEMSFRVWQCGGRVEISPCSRVGHVFRKASPYTFPGGVGEVLHSNLARVANTWLDQYKQFFFKVNSFAGQAALGQDVSDRLSLRERLQCKDFDWYLDNVWPENFMPRTGQFFGKFRNVKEGKCLEKPRGKGGTGSTQPSGPAALGDCGKFYQPQLFTMTGKGYVMGDENVCLDSVNFKEKGGDVRFGSCSEVERQRWKIEGTRLVHVDSGKCVGRARGGTSEVLILEECTEEERLEWELLEEKWN